MKLINNFYYVLISILLLCIISCSNDDHSDNKNRTPQVILNDFQKRYPSVSIQSIANDGAKLHEIRFLDQDKNEGVCIYIDMAWEMSQLKLKDPTKLPEKVQKAFDATKYTGVPFWYVYKTDRAGIERSLYTLHFLFPVHDIRDVTHDVLINDDGLLLDVLTSGLSDHTWGPHLGTARAAHFDFIAEKYKDSDIRGYINNAGSHEYFVLHEGIMKYVFFRNVDESQRGFWEKTEYALDINTNIPENVIKDLKNEYPDFNYTDIVYREEPDGDSYWFIDKNDPFEKGYIIPINIGLAR